jgi:purine-binding chemotaxis protein CheW
MNAQIIDTDQKEIQMVVFTLGCEEYAIPITSVQEIIMPQIATRIPKAPEFVEGVINLRGHIISIIDGKRKFSIEVTDERCVKEERIIVIESGNQTIGLTVNSVSEVINLATENIEAPPVDLESDADLLYGVGKYQNRLLILLNPEKLLSLSETIELKKVTELMQTMKEVKDSSQKE